MYFIEIKNGCASGFHGVEGLIKFYAIRIKNTVDILTINAENIVVVGGKIDARITQRG